MTDSRAPGRDPSPFVDFLEDPIPIAEITDRFAALGRTVMGLGLIPRFTRHPDTANTPESVATHTVMVTTLACCLANALNTGGTLDVSFDVGLVAQIAVSHDLEEAITTDVSTVRPLSREQATAKRAAARAANRHLMTEFARTFPWMTILAYGETSTSRELVEFVDACAPKIAHDQAGCTDLIADGVTSAEFRASCDVQRAELLGRVVYDFPAVIGIYDQLVSRVVERLIHA
jgi:5'-deoxynucleotidase YfbR-like HD superfamily hydrolase